MHKNLYAIKSQDIYKKTAKLLKNKICRFILHILFFYFLIGASTVLPSKIIVGTFSSVNCISFLPAYI